ncbi:MAG: DUF4838 domain-containing protein [Kiritimatiellia bacterium]|nr:DUF4838 domain-containing protein [Kiritimatiellia bacterium]
MVRSMGIIGVLWLVAMGATPAYAGPFALVQNGRPAADIMIDPKANEYAPYAAKELVAYVKKISGVELKIAKRRNPSRGVIRIGRPGGAAEATDSIACFVNRQGELELTGQGTRGNAYAVYKFLEHAFGVRYWSPWREKVPSMKTLAVPSNYALRQTPAFEWREGWGVSDNGRPSVINPWKVKAGRNGCVWPPAGTPYRAGAGETMMNQFLKPDKYFAQHPDWYALVNGTRKGTQICASNPEAIARLIEEVREALRKQPDTLVQAMGSQDNSDFCQCKKCAALVAKYRSGNTALEVIVVNQVAKALAKEFPRVRFSLLAYWTKEQPPQGLPLEPNVAVCLAIARNMVAPVYKDAGWVSKTKGWEKLCKGGIYFWDYYANFVNFQEPRPDFINIGPNLRYYRDHGYRGGFAQMRLGELAYFGELTAYLWAQLMWNPDQDENAIIKEYITENYGAAAPDILALWNLQLNAMRSCKTAWMGMYGSNYDEWYRAKEMCLAWDLVNHALEVTKNSPADHRQVEYLYCATLNDFCLRWDRQGLDKYARSARLKYPLAAPWDLVEELDDLRTEYRAGYWGEARGWDRMIGELRDRYKARKVAAGADPRKNPYKGKNFRAYTKREVKVGSKAQQW